jgi:elongation factor Ts
LVEADGDFDLAIENLRKRKVAANRSIESTEAAAIAVVNADKMLVLLSLNQKLTS